MGASGAIVMGFFGAGFASLTLLLQLRWHGLALALPFIGFAIIAAAATIVTRRPGTGFAKPERAGRAIMWSSIGEGIGLFLVNQTLISLGRADLIIPAMTIVVGLHFVAIAYWAPFRPLYGLATAMLAAGVAGVALHQPAGGILAGFAAAAALGVASIAAIGRERSAKLRWRRSHAGA